MPYARRSAHKVDAHQAELIADLRRFGFTVANYSGAGEDLPDLAIGRQGVTALLEVKTPRGLNDAYRISVGQQLFAQNWRGSPIIYGHKAEGVTRDFVKLLKHLGQWK
jgi:Holliday junction resolvase